ncbi:two-component system, OmpR family, response regulator [Rubritalea squalenifaciens DSM 18772]|uniref:Two-component system, OmpR family, response regulator n=2 Tax=Rubritalea squalenifaciens TaxID=407226 RepID=A0A1M6R9D4_9BACT|nr:two-component system, OmpR family, response regulator [Rubritalea squalenifaciens DSM 18772]
MDRTFIHGKSVTQMCGLTPKGDIFAGVEASKSSRFKSMKILVVEDNDFLRETLVEALTEEGYVVDSSADGEDGLFQATECNYDLIILDVMLPEKDGWEVLKGIRSHPSCNNVAVIMLTARDGTEDRVKGLDGGADDYLTKPFKLMELFARIRSIMRRSAGPERASELMVGDVTVNTNTRSIFKNGVDVAATTLEYNLVEALLAKRGEVVSRNDLYMKLFSEEKEVTSNILDVYICNVRNKLGKEFIMTKRGYGYYISA